MDKKDEQLRIDKENLDRERFEFECEKSRLSFDDAILLATLPSPGVILVDTKEELEKLAEERINPIKEWAEKNRDTTFEADKFIVINRKHVDLLKVDKDHPEHHKKILADLYTGISDFSEAFENLTGKKLNQKYYVCNQDEPYAENIIKMILEGEEEKTR